MKVSTHGVFNWDCNISIALKEKIAAEGFRLKNNPTALPVKVGKKKSTSTVKGMEEKKKKQNISPQITFFMHEDSPI